MAAATKAQVFIIESLNFDDEEKQRHEGEILARMLRLTGKVDPKYFYIRTRKELRKIVDQFDESGFRYLHLSCHANATSMGTTLDDISYEELGALLAPHLKGRRVFVSGCEMSNPILAKALLAGSGCFSLVGPARDVLFSDAAAFWVTFYHLMFKADSTRMQHAQVGQCVSDLSKLFKEPFNYYRMEKTAKAGFKKVATAAV